MKSKLIILTMVALLSCGGFALAEQGHDHEEHGHEGHKGSMKADTFSSEAVEVGNKICPVSNEPVDEMGEPVQYEYKGKIYNFCCKMCVKDFKKNPEKYIKILEDMEELESEGEAEHKESHAHETHDHDH